MRRNDGTDGHGKRAAMAATIGGLVAMVCAAAAWAEGTSAKAPIPGLWDILSSSGITASGYVDATYAYFSYAGATAAKDYDSFLFQQAGLTLAYQPASGFGALLDVVATPYASPYVNNYAPDSHYYLSSGTGPGAPNVTLLQGYAQYAGGAWTVIAGKFTTLAGAEVYAPSGNTNVTRSILFSEEPLTHTGVRATYAANSELSLIIGVNNGWFNAGDEASTGPDKTLEAGIALTPGKALSWTLQNYYGRDALAWGPPGLRGSLELLDSVLTWNATPALTLIGSADYGNAGATRATASASWWGVAGYVNYAIHPRWRLSLRGEYFDDRDGYLTGGFAHQLAEGTATLGFAASRNFELRFEGRYDAPQSIGGLDRFAHTVQGWCEVLVHW